MYIVSYDISNNKRRRKIAKEMENYGVRVQYSVFECSLDKDRYKELYAKLLRLMENDEEGSIRIYDLCQSCKGKTRIIGTEKKKGKDDRREVIVL